MAFNSTSVPLDLYAGVDFTSLSWLEQQWAAWYVWIGNPIIATGLASFLLHEVCPLGLFRCSTADKSQDCLLWTQYPLDYYRRDALLPQVEASTHQNPHSGGTVVLHEASPALALYYRAPRRTSVSNNIQDKDYLHWALDLGLPPYGRGSWNGDLPSSFSNAQDYGTTDPSLLCF